MKRWIMRRLQAQRERLDAQALGAREMRGGFMPTCEPGQEAPKVPPPKPMPSCSNGLGLDEIMALPPRPPQPPDCARCDHAVGAHLMRRADRGCDVIGCDCRAYEPVGPVPIRDSPMAPESR